MQSLNKKVPITFITGNKKKLEEFLTIMTGDSSGFELGQRYDINNMALDLDELQGHPADIAKAKVSLAATKVNNPVITEDVSLCFNAYNGLPGPYM